MFKSCKSKAKNLGNQLSCSKPFRLNENQTFSHSVTQELMPVVWMQKSQLCYLIRLF